MLRSIAVFIGMMCWLPPSTLAQLTYAQLRVEYDSAWTFKNLQLVPVRFKHKPEGVLVHNGLPGIALPEALANGKAKVREVQNGKGADLNLLEVTNTSRQTLMVNSGDLLSGGKQDRIIGQTTIIPPGQKDYLKVYCVEKGRWDDKIKPFKNSGTADASLRRVMDKSGRQHEVWREIERRFSVENIPSTTWPYVKLTRKSAGIDSSYRAFFLQRLQQSDSAYAGFLAISGDEIISCELFASQEMTMLSFSSMLDSWIPVAVKAAPPVVPLLKQKTFMDNLLESEAAQKSFVAANGQMHKYLGRVVHIIVYGNE